jgi:hypothetical protein
MALVGRTVASGALDVPPGMYFVTASLPSGEQVTQQVNVTGSASPIVVELPGIPSDAAGAARRTLSADDLARVSQYHYLQEPVPLELLPEFNLWVGNLVSGSMRRVEGEVPALSLEGRVIDGRDETQCARLRNDDGEQWFVLPAWTESECRIVDLILRPADLVIELQNPQANLLLQLRAKGKVSDEQTALESWSLTSERLLRDKRRDPVAAVVSAYTLLRFNELERLHDWTRNMFRWFETLPDAAVIYGEHLGRLGRHEEALAALLTLGARGLPLFSEGIGLAIDRLTLYERYGGKTFSTEQSRAAAKLSNRLEDFAAIADLARPTTTLRGKLPVP